MAFIDRRNKALIYKDGSSLVSVGLTPAQAVEALGAGSPGGWYGLGYLAGGTVGRDNNASKQYDESGEPVVTITTVDDFTVQNVAQQTDAATIKLFKWLETHDVPVRYVLPTPDPDVVQVHYHPAVSKDVGQDAISTSQGIRTMQFTLRGKKSNHVFADVAADQSDWATNGLEDALDAAFPAS